MILEALQWHVTLKCHLSWEFTMKVWVKILSIAFCTSNIKQFIPHALFSWCKLCCYRATGLEAHFIGPKDIERLAPVVSTQNVEVKVTFFHLVQVIVPLCRT